MRNRSHKAPRPPLDGAALERLALLYVERYATSRAKLASYLARKLRERGWNEPEAAPVEAIVARIAALGYVDDAAFADARSAALSRRGFGARRVSQALRAAGIGAEDAAAAEARAHAEAMDAALRFARRRRLGPYAAVPPDRPARQKAFAAMLRAGHPMDLVRRLLACAPGEDLVQEND